MRTIRVELTETSVITRWPCGLCGGVTGKYEVLAEADGVGIVCEWCLERGPAAAAQTLQGHAEELERRAAQTLEAHAEELKRRAADLRELAEAEWEMPTLDQFRDEEVAVTLITGWGGTRTAPPIANDGDGTWPF